MSRALPRIVGSRKTGRERFHRSGEPLELDLLGFWQWSASDLLSNATRGILAEYLVAVAMAEAGGIRSEWDAYDVTSAEGIRIEVKSCAYLQSWYQKTYSRISFDISETHAWDAETNESGTERKRQADVYVFCLLAHRDQATVDPLDTAQWTFFVVSTGLLNRHCSKRKRIGLEKLRQIGAKEVGYEGLRGAVEAGVS